MTLRSTQVAVSFDNETIRRRSVHGAAITAVAQAMRFGLQFGSMIVLTRLLEPAQFGLIALVAPLLGFVKALNDLGFGPAVVQRADIGQRQISWLFWINLAISTALAAAVMLAAPAIGWFYGEPKVMPVVITLASLIVVTTLPLLPGALLNRQMRFLALSIVEIASLAVGVAVGIASAYVGFGYWSLVLMQAANAVTALLLTWRFAGWWPSRPAPAPDGGSLLRFGAHITGSNLATYFAMSGDNIIIGLVCGKVALGLYDRSYNLVVQPLTQIMAPVSRIAVPLLSRLSDDGPRFERAYLEMLRFTLFASVPGLLYAIFTARPTVLLLFGTRWVAIAPIVAWICFGGLATSINSSAGWIFIAQNRTRELLTYVTVNAGISIASFAIGVIWGVLGVAVVSAVSFAFIQTPLLIWAATRVGAVTMRALLNATAPFAVAGLASAVALSLTRFEQHGALGLLASLALSYAVFGTGLACLPGGKRFLAGLCALRSTFRVMA